MRLRHPGVTLAAAMLSAGMLSAAGPQLAHATTTEATDAGDTIATATVISGAETTITGTLTADTDRADIYAITITDHTRFSASTFGSQLQDLSLSLFDGQGHLIEYDNRWVTSWDTNFWGTLPAATTGNPYAPISNGTYYLGVNPVGGPQDDSGGGLYGGTYWSPNGNSQVYGPADPTAVLGGWGGDATGSYVISLTGVGSIGTLPTLYAVGHTGGSQGAPTADSSLYTVDTNDGHATLVGPIELNGSALQAISGIAFGLDGKLYAVDNKNRRLLTLATAADNGVVNATPVGPFGSYDAQISDIAFDAYGYLYGVAPNTAPPDSLGLSAFVRLDANGTLRPIGEDLDFDNSGDGLATAPNGQMYLKDQNVLHRINQQTGALGTEQDLSQGTNNAADFSPDGTLFTIVRPQDNGLSGAGSTLETVNLTSGFVSPIGNDSTVMITGIAFFRGVGTPPGGSTDLHIEKSVDNDNPSPGDDVTFTISLANPGSSAATGVTVTDVLPDSLTYKNADSVDFDAETGVWTIGTLAGSATATLHITVTAVTPGADVTNAATYATDQYNPGPTIGRAELYIAPVPPGAPTVEAVAGDRRVLVTWTPPTNDGGDAVVSYQLYRCSGSTTGCTVDQTSTPTTIDASEGSKLVTGLTNGTVYGFAMTAVNHAGEGTLSTTAYATPRAPSISITRAWPNKGKVYVSFTKDVAPLEQMTGYGPVVLGVTGSKGVWTSCTMDGDYCTVKSSAKTVTMRISDNGGADWYSSAAATVSRK